MTDVWVARAHANGIGGERASTVVDAVAKVVAFQGQDVRANRLAVRVRTSGLTHEDVDLAVSNGDVVRTWALRGTLHMVAAADLRWVLRVVGPYFRDRQRPRRLQLGLDDVACERGTAQLERILTSPLTRAEIKERVDLDLSGQAAPYLLAFAALEGVVCRGPERGSEPTYVLVRDWVTGGDRDGQLALRYLHGHQPAGPRDLAVWSGLPLTVARQAFEEVRDLLEPAGEGFVIKGSRLSGVGEVRLLGLLDGFLLGYRERSVSAEFARKVQSGGGFVSPVISVGGQVRGVWRQRSTRDSLVIEVTPFTTISARLRRELSREVADLGRFLGQRTSLSVTESAVTD